MEFTPLLAEIATALMEVTPAQIERARSYPGPLEEGEELIAVVDDEEAHRLWVLADDYDRKYNLVSHAYRFDAVSNEDRKQILQQATRLYALERIVRHLAWRRFEDMAGCPTTPNGKTFGLRENFALVSMKRPPQQQLLGDFSLSREVMSSFVEMLRGRSEPEPEEEAEKEKPQ